jgi:FlaA1/EpsC-like NDP-sugar epimerase
MRLSTRTVEYAGIVDPSTPAEIRIEILGLRNAIRQAEELISRHEQALELAQIMGRSIREAQQRSAEEDQRHVVAEETGGTAEEKAEANQGSPPLVR